LFLSTVYTGHEVTERLRHRPTTTAPYAQPIKQKFDNKGELKLLIPSVAADYNDLMNGVDISDHYRSNNTTDHRQRRGPARALAWSFLLTTAVANSFLLQKLGQPAWKAYKAQSQWQQRLVNDIFNTYGKTGSSRQRYRAGDEVTPAEQHKHVNRKKQGRCLGCQGIQIGPRSRSSQRGRRRRAPLIEASDDSLNRRVTRRKAGSNTQWGCGCCDVAICKRPECWYFYHRQEMPATEVP
jgi:hypothetical protein